MENLYKLLNDNKVMNLATCSDDKPRSSIMEYIMVGDAMIIATSPDSIKAKNIAKNNRISLTVGNMPIYAAIDGKVTDANAEEINGYNKELLVRYPEFKEMMDSGAMTFKHFRVVFDTAYYSEGMAPAKVIKMGK